MIWEKKHCPALARNTFAGLSQLSGVRINGCWLHCILAHLCQCCGPLGRTSANRCCTLPKQQTLTT